MSSKVGDILVDNSLKVENG